MNTGFLYHAFGVREQECSKVRYEDNQIVLNVQTKVAKLRCPCCKKRNFVRYGVYMRRIKSIPIGNKPIILEVRQRLYCHKVVRERLHFVSGKHGYTNKLANLVLELSRVGTIKDVARFLHLSWDTVKGIQKTYHQHKYKNSNLNPTCS